MNIVDAYASGKKLDELFLLILVAFFGIIAEMQTRSARNRLTFQRAKSQHLAYVDYLAAELRKKTDYSIHLGAILNNLRILGGNAKPDGVSQSASRYDAFFVIVPIIAIIALQQSYAIILFTFLIGISIPIALLVIRLMRIRVKFNDFMERFYNFIVRTSFILRTTPSALNAQNQRRYEKLLKDFVTFKYRITSFEGTSIEISKLLSSVVLIGFIGVAAADVLDSTITEGAFSGIVILSLRITNAINGIASAFIYRLIKPKYKHISKRSTEDSATIHAETPSVPVLQVNVGRRVLLEFSLKGLQLIHQSTFEDIKRMNSGTQSEFGSVYASNLEFSFPLDGDSTALIEQCRDPDVTVRQWLTSFGAVTEKEVGAFVSDSALFDKIFNLPQGFNTSLVETSEKLGNPALDVCLQIISARLLKKSFIVLNLTRYPFLIDYLEDFCENFADELSGCVICYYTGVGRDIYDEHPIPFQKIDYNTKPLPIIDANSLFANLKKVSGLSAKSDRDFAFVFAHFLHKQNIVSVFSELSDSLPYFQPSCNLDTVEEFLFNKKLLYKRSKGRIQTLRPDDFPVICVNQRDGKPFYIEQSASGEILCTAYDGLKRPPSYFKLDRIEWIQLRSANDVRQSNPISKLNLVLDQKRTSLYLLSTIENLFKLSPLIFVGLVYTWVFPQRDLQLLIDVSVLLSIATVLALLFSRIKQRILGSYTTEFDYGVGVSVYETLSRRLTAIGERFDEMDSIRFFEKFLFDAHNRITNLFDRRSRLPFNIGCLMLLFYLDIVTGSVCLFVIFAINASAVFKDNFDFGYSSLVKTEDSARKVFLSGILSGFYNSEGLAQKAWSSKSKSSQQKDTNAWSNLFSRTNTENVLSQGVVVVVAVISLMSILSQPWDPTRTASLFIMVMLIWNCMPELIKFSSVVGSFSKLENFADELKVEEPISLNQLEAIYASKLFEFDKVIFDRATVTDESKAPVFLGFTAEFRPKELIYLQTESKLQQSVFNNLMMGYEIPKVGEVLINGQEADKYRDKTNSKNLVVFDAMTDFVRDPIHKIITGYAVTPDYDRLKAILNGLDLTSDIQNLSQGFNHRIRDFMLEPYAPSFLQKIDLARVLYSGASIKILNQLYDVLPKESVRWALAFLVEEVRKQGKLVIVTGENEDYLHYASRRIMIEDSSIKSDETIQRPNLKTVSG